MGEIIFYDINPDEPFFFYAGLNLQYFTNCQFNIPIFRVDDLLRDSG